MLKKYIISLIIKILLIIVSVSLISGASGCNSLILREFLNDSQSTTQDDTGKPESSEDQKNNENQINNEEQLNSEESIKNDDSKDNILFLEALNESISALVEEVQPSVVNINIISGGTSDSEGIGSGVIYSSDGYIITNNHVAGNAQEMEVILSDGTSHPAILVGATDLTDIAVIKIDMENLRAAKFAKIENQNVGDLVIAIGSPFGIQQTVTLGIISGKGRNISATSDTVPIVDLIQTDTPINPGNSGGPLINIYGEVIGINTLIFSTSGASAGIGFAIPSDTATNIAGQIIKYGRAVIPYVGVEMGLNDSEIQGVLVDSVTKDSPAEKAGIKGGDILIEFRDKELKNPYDLLTQILRSNCGETVPIKIYRDKQYTNINIELSECPVLD